MQAFMYNVFVDRYSTPYVESMCQWIESQGLKYGDAWVHHTLSGTSKVKFSFRDSEHAMWFKLRWL